MTEDEAKTKWCPFVRIVSVNHVLEAIRFMDEDNEINTACIASECMAWRFLPCDPDTDDVPHGYCGLAGKP